VVDPAKARRKKRIKLKISDASRMRGKEKKDAKRSEG